MKHAHSARQGKKTRLSAESCKAKTDQYRLKRVPRNEYYYAGRPFYYINKDNTMFEFCGYSVLAFHI